MPEVLNARMINFFGEPIAVVETELEVNGTLEPVLGVVARRLVEQLGLDWSSQLQKLRDDEDNRYRAFEGRAQGPDGKEYSSTIIPLSSVNAFLFSINRKNLSDDDKVTTRKADGTVITESKKEKLIRYQDECSTVLYDYWQHGAAMNFRANASDIDSQKTHDILQTSRKRYNNMFNNLVASILDGKGKRGEEFEEAVKEFTGELEAQIRDQIVMCMEAAEIDFDKGLIRYNGQHGMREMSGMEAIRISILENCVCDLIGQFRRKEVGNGEDYSVILQLLPEYFDDYLSNVGNQVLNMRSTFNRGRGLFPA